MVTRRLIATRQRRRNTRAARKGRQVATKSYVNRKLGNQIETKMFNGGYGNDSNVNTNGSIHDLSIITTGVAQGTRVSNMIQLKKLIFNAYITQGQSSFLSSDAFQNVRIILFRWREDSSVATPVLSDIIDTVSNATNYGVSMPYNYNTRQKYEVIWDKTVMVYPEPEYNGSTLEFTVAGPGACKIIRKQLFGKKLGAKHIKYNDNASVSGHGYNKLYALFMSDSLLSPHADVRFNSQVYYEDA